MTPIKCFQFNSDDAGCSLYTVDWADKKVLICSFPSQQIEFVLYTFCTFHNCTVRLGDDGEPMNVMAALKEIG